MFSEKLNGEEKLNAEKKENGSFQEKRKSGQIFSFKPGGVFNISITLLIYCGGYPWGDEFPTWSFEVARCVFVYTYSRPSLPSRGGTYSELVCLGIYKFITIYIYSHICI